MPKKKIATATKTGKKTRAKKKTGSAETAMTKAAFIRSLPRSTPAEEVVAKGAEANLKFTKEYVWGVRSKGKTKKSSGKKASKKTTAKSASTATGKGDKKSRVLQLVAKHPDWSRAKVAEAAGCTPNHVYTVLKESGQNGEKSAAAPSNGVVGAFYKAVKSIGGVGKAKELLANIEAYENA